MFTENNILEDMNVCLGLARGQAPYKTGNVRFNAISSYRTNDGFVIKYSLGDAFYIYFLEEGTRFTTRHQGFIGQRTVPLIADYLYSKYASKDSLQVAQFQTESMYGNSDEDSYKGEDYLLPRMEKNLESKAMDIESMANDYGWEHNQSLNGNVPDKFAKR